MGIEFNNNINRGREEWKKKPDIVEIENPAMKADAESRRKASQAARGVVQKKNMNTSKSRRQRVGIRNSVLGTARTSSKKTLGGQ